MGIYPARIGMIKHWALKTGFAKTCGQDMSRKILFSVFLTADFYAGNGEMVHDC